MPSSSGKSSPDTFLNTVTRLMDMSSNGKPEFHTDYISPRVSPLHDSSVGFDFEQVERDLGQEELNEDSHTQLGELVARLFSFVTNVEMNGNIEIDSQGEIGRKFCAIVWVLNPGLFEGSPFAKHLAEILRVTSDSTFQALTVEVSHYISSRVSQLNDSSSVKAELDARMRDFIARLFAFATEVPLRNSTTFRKPTAFRKYTTERMIGRRFAAIAWVMNPGLFDGSPSATQLAKLLQVKSAPAFMAITGQVRREFGISNRAQAHAWNNGRKSVEKNKIRHVSR